MNSNINEERLMAYQIKDKAAYQQVTDAFRKQRQGATVADIVAQTALPLATVKELVPAVADEYAGRLQVTESGEIRYSFPHGFTSRYRGVKAGWRRFTEKLGKGFKLVSKGLFKGWIMVMLVGYFALFMLIALAALLLSVGASLSNSNNRSEGGGGGLGGLFLASHIFDLIIRIWFYSELVKAFDPNAPTRQPPQKKRPLYKAIFSFVFGDDDPNADWSAREKQAVIAYLQASKGVISLPEFMNLTGHTPEEADRAITAYCVEFGGSPEATDDGTVVYRFDALLLRASKHDLSFSASAPLKRLKAFSSNEKKVNVSFSLINGVNLIFGSYFLWNAMTTGAVAIAYRMSESGKKVGHFVSQASGDAASMLYGFTYALSSIIWDNPLPFIMIGLGVVPLVFSMLFWLVPLLRSRAVKQENERIKMENLRKVGYSRIWDSPREVQSADLSVELDACRPKRFAAAQEQVVKEVSAYAMPEVSLAADGTTAVYDFTELEREKAALETYRAGVRNAGLGKTVFDSGE
jgi:hypothetical protein